MSDDSKQWKYLPAHHVETLEAEIERLRTEIERLWAAGDALEEALTWDQSCPYDAATTRVAIARRRLAWKEARRG